MNEETKEKEVEVKDQNEKITEVKSKNIEETNDGCCGSCS
jgi:hypothetical protein